MYIVVSFGLIYLIEHFGNWGIVILFVPFLVSYGFGFRHFEMLEKLRVKVVFNNLIYYIGMLIQQVYS